MKLIIKVLSATLLMLVGFTVLASAEVLNFDDQYNLGVTLSGWMHWDGSGGGHLYCDPYINVSIEFSNTTYVNSFQMNSMPEPGYSGPGGQIDIAAFDDSGKNIWQTTVDLPGDMNWANWLTVNVGVADVSYLEFYSPYYTHGNLFYPSVDNLTINEQTVPEPTSLILLSLGLGGLASAALFGKKLG